MTTFVTAAKTADEVVYAPVNAAFEHQFGRMLWSRCLSCPGDPSSWARIAWAMTATFYGSRSQIGPAGLHRIGPYAAMLIVQALEAMLDVETREARAFPGTMEVWIQNDGSAHIEGTDHQSQQCNRVEDP